MISTMIKRDTTVDFLKGFTAILVVLGHVIQFTHSNYEINILYNIIYSFHMPLFMFLSGYVMVYAFQNGFDYKEFIKKRFIQLMVPFFCWAVIGSVYRSLRHISELNFLTFFYNFANHIIKPEHGLWYCWVLFFICAIHGFVNIVTDKYSEKLGGGVYSY